MLKKLKKLFQLKKTLLVKFGKFLKKFFAKKSVIASLIVVFILVLFYFARSLFFAAWVNGRPISRLSLTRELEKQGGQQVLDSLVERALVYSEAKKSNIKVEQSEIDNEIKNIEEMISAQGLTLDEALQFRNQTRTDLVDQIKIQKLVEKLLASKIVMTDAELKDYFDKNKSLFGQNPVFDTVKDQVKEQVFQQKLSEQYSTWITDLKTKAKILYFVNL